MQSRQGSGQPVASGLPVSCTCGTAEKVLRILQKQRLFHFRLLCLLCKNKFPHFNLPHSEYYPVQLYPGESCSNDYLGFRVNSNPTIILLWQSLCQPGLGVPLGTYTLGKVTKGIIYTVLLQLCICHNFTLMG